MTYSGESTTKSTSSLGGSLLEGFMREATALAQVDFELRYSHPVVLIEIPRALRSQMLVPGTLPILVLPVHLRADLDQARVVLGRSSSSDICLPFSSISRTHAIIMRDIDGQFWIEDAGSRNGTFYNGEPLDPGGRRPLEDDPHIQLGDLELRFLSPASFYRELRRGRSQWTDLHAVMH